MKTQLITLLSLIILGACASPKKSNLTQQPTLEDYQIGEKWIWKIYIPI